MPNYDDLTPLEDRAAARRDAAADREKAWGQAAQFLATLVESGKPVRSGELVQQLGMSKEQVYDLGCQLEDAGLIVRSEDRGRPTWSLARPRVLEEASRLPQFGRLEQNNTDPNQGSSNARLFKAALKSVAQHGYAGTTIEKIAAEAGIPEVTVYRDFPNKLDLIREAVTTELHELDNTVPLPSASLEKDLETIARNYQKFWREHLDLLAIVPEVNRIPELKSAFVREQRVVVDKWIGLCLYHRARGSWRAEFDELSPEQLEWDISSLLLGPLLAQVVWVQVGLDYGVDYDPSMLVANILWGISRLPKKTGKHVVASRVEIAGSTQRRRVQSLDLSEDSILPPSTLPADLDLRVRLRRSSDHTRLVYSLNAPTGKVEVTHKDIEGPRIASPDAFQAALIRKIELLHARRDMDGDPLLKSESFRQLTSLGQQLYRQLFPPQLRHAYRDFRSKIRSFQIVSDEPWIPWELIKPYEAEHPVIDDDFLASQFLLTRWLAGDRAAPTAARVRRSACIDASDVQDLPLLPTGKVECQQLKELIGKHPGVRDVSPLHATCEEVMQVLRGGANWIHFVGHGDSDPTCPDEAKLILSDGRALRPGDFDAETQRKLAESRPLVFLNTCRSGHQGWSFTGLGGWVRLWLEGCASSVFVGSHWTVCDELAHIFAMTFYTALIEDRTTFGEAAQRARQQVRKLQPENPSWLAFTVYAHPNGRLALGPEA